MAEATKILVVEDDMIIQMFIQRTLAEGGYSIIGEARSGEEALALTIEHNPALILMDIGIVGGYDGIEAARRILTSHDVKIVFMTGNSDAATIARAKQVSDNPFIFKPIDEVHLLQRVADLLKDQL